MYVTCDAYIRMTRNSRHYKNLKILMIVVEDTSDFNTSSSFTVTQEYTFLLRTCLTSLTAVNLSFSSKLSPSPEYCSLIITIGR